MAWTDIPDTNIEPDKPVLATDILAIRDNIVAQANGDPGAPQQQTAGIANAAITQAKVAASAIGQSQLKTAEGEVSVATGTQILILPGGSYGFYPRIRASDSNEHYYASIGGESGIRHAFGTSYLARIVLGGAAVGSSVYATQVHVQASPPYDLGDGEIGQFIFALVDTVGRVLAVYSAKEAPWHHNGPTDISADYYDENGRGWRVDCQRETVWIPLDGDYIPVSRKTGESRVIEITQAIKQADMPIIPHPFLGNDLTDKTVVLLDPVAELTWTLAEMHEQGVSPNELLHDDYIRIGNDPLNRAGPPGVMVAQAKWKLT